jgi:hypothetical protein
MSDLVFEGGKTGVVFGNQQFTVRNLAFYNVQTAINQLWNWGWTYQASVFVSLSAAFRELLASSLMLLGIVINHDHSSPP